MCGIAGFVQRHGLASEAVIKRQVATMTHRGPDSHGWYARGRGIVAQNRLAIIDLLTGDPPITSEDGTLGVAYNGEIYNFAALREDLQRTGHTMATRCDTEVIAHLAEDLTPVEVARRLDGMFAFAVWDERRDLLVLGRDRLGKKPLHYWAGADAFVFGSEIKSVLAHPAVTTGLDATAIPSYLGFGYVPSPRTFYEGIRSVPPGHVLTVGPDLEITIERYWEPQIPRPGGPSRLDLSLDEAANEVRTSLAAAVRRRLMSDVPLGAFLSGGVDSSAIVGLMAQELRDPVRTFTIGFEDQDGYDERPHARAVAERFGTDHTEFVVSPQAVDLVDELVWHHDQPFGDSSAVPTYLLSELTKKHVTVALCGDGGDEIFAGYERFAAAVASERYASIPAPLRHGGERLLELLPARGRAAKIRRFASVAAKGMPDSLRSWISYVGDADLGGLCPGADVWGREDYRRIWCATAGGHPLDRVLLLNLQTYLLDDLLPKVDRMSMAHGLEVRAPFLDHHLVELALRLPPRTKQRGLAQKRVLKAAVADLLPASILERRKHGFGVPLDRWFRQDLATMLDGTLGAPDARLRAHVRPEALDRLLGEHQSGRKQHGHALWTLLTLELFLRRQGW